jgi:hypothetical protein
MMTVKSRARHTLGRLRVLAPHLVLDRRGADDGTTWAGRPGVREVG